MDKDTPTTSNNAERGQGMTRELSWTANGHTCKVTATLRTAKTVDADGVAVKIDCCEMSVTLQVDGRIVGYGAPIRCQGLPNGRVARMGRASLTAARTAEIEAMIAELKATPEWQAKLANDVQAETEAAGYDAHRARMRTVMGY